MQDLCLIYASVMHTSFECPSLGPSDVINEHVNTIQGFPPTTNPYSNTYNHGWKNYPSFSWRCQNVDNPQT